MVDSVTGDALPLLPEQQPRPREASYTFSGEALDVIESLVPEVAGARDGKDVLLTAVAVLRQARRRTIQFADDQGRVTELPTVWS